MIQRLKRVSLGVAIGLGLLVLTTWVLIHTLADRDPLYQGKPIEFWVAQVNSTTPAVSNDARVVIQQVVVPSLLTEMFHDTHDSKLRFLLIDELNTLPGVNIYFLTAAGRRAQAAAALGMLGPQAQAAIPDLVKAVKGNDPAVRGAAAKSLGDIHGQPEKTIPLLTTLIDDPQDDVPEAAITALGNFGALSRPALPKLLPLLKMRDKDLQHALRVALKQIDPEAAAKAGVN